MVDVSCSGQLLVPLSFQLRILEHLGNPPLHIPIPSSPNVVAHFAALHTVTAHKPKKLPLESAPSLAPFQQVLHSISHHLQKKLSVGLRSLFVCFKNVNLRRYPWKEVEEKGRRVPRGVMVG